jgi:DNA-binding LacI/PurR family transcriptional regulator
MGREAAKRILEMIDTGGRVKPLVMDIELIVKDSTGPEENNSEL